MSQETVAILSVGVLVLLSVAGTWRAVWRESGRIREEASDAHEKIGQRIDGVDERLGQRIDGVDERLGQRIDGVSERLGQRIDGVSEKLVKLSVDVGGFRGSTEEQIRQLQATVTTTSTDVATLNTRTAELTGAIEVITRLAVNDPE